MNEIKKMEMIIEEYAKDAEIQSMRCKYMELMLDEACLSEKAHEYKEDRLYIYGAGLLGVQLYKCLKDIGVDADMVDKKGRAFCKIRGLEVIRYEDFSKIYNGGNVIVTPITFFQEIHDGLRTFVPENRIVFLGEFLGETV